MKKIAIVTGASSGLGREYVKAIDKQLKLDEIWLIARRKERLLSLQDEVHTSLKVIPLDLSEPASIDKLEECLEKEKPNIKMLVCSAGFGRVGSYQDISRKDVDNMIDLNCRAAVDVTNISIPYMQNGSHIVEVCSMVGFQPLSYMNIYAASKAFLLRYSRALRVELKHTGIKVTAVCPYWVTDTEFVGESKKSKNASYVTFYKGAAKTVDVVESSMKDILKGKAVSTPSVVSKTMRVLAKVLPTSLILYGWEKIRN